MVFPEGVKGTGKPFSERYRLQRFGRGGFVEVALRTGAPIVPVAVVGSEEIYPKIGDSPALARAIGAPFVPITPTFPWLGPLGLVPLPSRWRIEFCEPIDLSGASARGRRGPPRRLRPLRAGPRDDPGEALREPGQARLGLLLADAAQYRSSGDGDASTATATKPRHRRRRPAASEFRAALEQALAEVDADERIGPLIGATGLRLRFEFTDLELALNVAAGRGRPQPASGRSPTSPAGSRSSMLRDGPRRSPTATSRGARASRSRSPAARCACERRVAGRRCSTCRRPGCSASPTARSSSADYPALAGLTDCRHGGSTPAAGRRQPVGVARRQDGNRPAVGRAARPPSGDWGASGEVREAPPAPTADEAGREARKATGPTAPSPSSSGPRSRYVTEPARVIGSADGRATISLSEAARISGVSPSTLKRWARGEGDPGQRRPLDHGRRGAGAGRRADARARPLARRAARAPSATAGSPSATSRTCCPGAASARSTAPRPPRGPASRRS